MGDGFFGPQCINELPDGINSICKIFADNTSLFSKVIDTRDSQNALNFGLESISNWVYQWKLQFNFDPKKQANEVSFLVNRIHLCIHQSHPLTKLSLNVVLDSKLEFNIHIEQKTNKYNKIIGLIRRLSISLPRKAFLTIYKSFVRPHLDYGDILFDKPDNQSFENKLGKVQYKVCLEISGAIKVLLGKDLMIN